MRLRQLFANDFSSSAFVGDTIVGKFGVIQQFPDGTFDCWFVGPDCRPLSSQKLAFLQKNVPVEWGLTALTGEAYTQGRGCEFVRQMAVYLGVRRKRKNGPHTVAKMTARLNQT